ncbi:MAG: GNAT family N-acetyltransferase [Desulfovibrio sp.]|nr:GNAT family N-acetyltransferase [Desulfovibrio sp.]
MNVCHANALPILASTPEDYAACADIWLEASLLAHDFVNPSLWKAQREAMERRCLPSSRVIMLQSGGRSVAFAALCTLDGEDLLAALFVAPPFWRKGFGRALLRHAMQGRTRLRLDVYRANTGALAFYESMGFVPVGESVCGHTGQPQIAMLWTAAAR